MNASQRAAVLAQEHSLGDVFYESRINWFYQLLRLVGVFFIIFFTWVLRVSYANPSNSIHDSFASEVGIVSFFTILYLFSGTALMLSIGMAANKRIWLCDKGFILKETGRIRVCLFADIGQIRIKEEKADVLGPIGFHFYECYFIDVNEVKYVINRDFFYYRQMVEVICEKVDPRLLQEHLQRFRDGETLKYGRLSISKDGIQKGRRRRSWHEVNAWKLHEQDNVDAAAVYFMYGDKRQIFQLMNKVANIHILIQLLKTIESEYILNNPEPTPD